jgi:hypothetical protein
MGMRGARKAPAFSHHRSGAPGAFKGYAMHHFVSRFEGFLRRVQTRGNAIHHFKDAKIGIQEELLSDVAEFLQFLLAVSSLLPYPDEAHDAAKA